MGSLKEECGIIGVKGVLNASQHLNLGLFAMQHRGQEGTGIITCQSQQGEAAEVNGAFHEHRSFGLVGDNYPQKVLDRLKGESGIGHVRYSTQGGELIQNVQPFSFLLPELGPVALAHNGNITNALQLKQALEAKGSVFQTTSDTEVFIHLLAQQRNVPFPQALKQALKEVNGAFSLVILTQESLYIVRDKYGFRPLELATLDGGYAAASETCAFDLIGAKSLREVEPGEVIEIDARLQVKSFFYVEKRPQKSFCSFEPIYFARPDSIIQNELIYELRKNLGRVLAAEHPTEADVVISIPDSGVPMAMGYAEVAKIPYEMGLVRNHYVGRTFIEPSQASRDLRVRLKLNPLRHVLEGKRVVVIDDSVVRGTTCIKILNMIRNAGAKEIHFRVASPPITHSCFYGIDTPNRSALMAAQKTVEEMRSIMGADSLAFLSLAGLKKALGPGSDSRYCFACFSGKYPELFGIQIEAQPTDRLGTGLSASKMPP